MRYVPSILHADKTLAKHSHKETRVASRGSWSSKTGFILASLRSKAFRKRVKENDYLIQVIIKDSNKGRYYRLKNGKLKSSGKVLKDDSDFALVWSDGMAFWRTIVKFSPKSLVESVFNSISTGRLKVEINVAPTVWFGMLMVDMANAIRGAA